jgi:hypothetical protein
MPEPTQQQQQGQSILSTWLSDFSTCCLCGCWLSDCKNGIAHVLCPAAADNAEFKRRIAVAMALLVSSKLLTIQVMQGERQLHMTHSLQC